MFELFLKGGPIMWPLLVCSLISVTILVERFLYFKGFQKGGGEGMKDIRSALEDGNIAVALEKCKAGDHPLHRVLAEGLAHYQRRGSVRLEEKLEEAALEEVPRFEKGLGALDTIITLAPLLGLLGTIIGMIQSFSIFSLAGSSQPNAITGGIAEALIATAAGLIIAIFTLVGHNFFHKKAMDLTRDIEKGATHLINSLPDTV